MSKHIGLLGGSFDPIHSGHLNLAREIMKARRLDEVWFCPAFINPFKRQGSAASVEDRINMINLAIEQEPYFRLCDLEIRREGPSYTIDTLRELTNLYKKDRFSLIMGSDAAHSFHLWREAEGVLKYADLLVGTRRGREIADVQGSPAIIAAIRKGTTVTPIVDISSTTVRKLLTARRPCDGLLPGKVLDYILSHDLYLAL